MVRKDKKKPASTPRIEQFTAMLDDPCPMLKSTAIHYFRKLFATDRNLTNVPEECEYYPRIVRGVLDFIRSGSIGDEGKVDAIWVITNMCCINQTINHLIVESQAISTLLQLMTSPNATVVNQCIWAIANISADCVDCKEKCRSPLVFRKLAEKLTRPSSDQLSPSDKKHIFWCINNLTSGGRVNIPNDVTRSLIHALSANFVHNETGQPNESAAKILWSLANIADDTSNLRRIDWIQDQTRLVENCMYFFLNQEHSKIHTAALRLIGNIAVGNDSQTDRLLEMTMFSHVLTVGMSKAEHRSEVAWICSNIAAGLPRHVDYLIQNDQLYLWVLKGIHSTERRLKKECLWIIANLLATADDAQLAWLVRQGVAHQLPHLLQADDIRLNEKAINASAHILRDHPWQARLFEELKIVGCIHETLLTDDALPVFSAQKRAIEMLIEQNRAVCEPAPHPSQRRLLDHDADDDDDDLKIVFYSKIDDPLSLC